MPVLVDFTIKSLSKDQAGSIVHFAVAAMFCARIEYWDRLGAVPSREILVLS